MSSFVFLPAIRDFHAGEHDWVTDTFKVMLLESGYTPDKTHEFVSDLVAFEASGTGYTGGFNGSGRKSVTGKTRVIDDPYVVCGADDMLTWTALDLGTLVAGVIIKEVTTDADSKVILHINGFSILTDTRNLNVTWNEDGIFRLINLVDLP